MLSRPTVARTWLGATFRAAGVVALLAGAVSAVSAEPLRVVASVPDLGDIARQVGGDLVEVSVITKGPEDAHFSQPKPSFIKALSEADAFVLVGMELEVGYAPVLLRSARNARVLPGAPGYIESSMAIEPIEIPSVAVDRSMGDVHAQGNPHYLLDPVNGLRVAALLRDRFVTLRPAQADAFRRGYETFHRAVGVALYGEALAAKYDVLKLARLGELGKLRSFLAAQGELESLGGWQGRLSRFAGTRFVDDHRMWPYFARRFELVNFGDMEPIPGVPPTTRHLQSLVEQMGEADVNVILASAYYDPRHARFLAEATGATIVRLAHQVGGLPGTATYLEMVDYNVSTLAAALEALP
jgi:ABC-type Zn uptake system ZnuABC Zn-binding protein ZnuA